MKHFAKIGNDQIFDWVLNLLLIPAYSYPLYITIPSDALRVKANAKIFFAHVFLALQKFLREKQTTITQRTLFINDGVHFKGERNKFGK